MANNKLHGYNPDPSKEVDGNRLDRINPREFRMGMDYELTLVGCSRLSESTEDDRRKATEVVLKNLTEHDGYYSNLIHYNTHFRNVDKKPAFKKWLSEQDEFKMKEVDQTYKNDKMTELKEAITKEIRNILFENENLTGKAADKANKADAKADKGNEYKAVNNAKTKAKELAALDKDERKAKDKKKELQNKFKPLMAKYNEDGDKEAYEKAVGGIPAEIKKINIELKSFIQKREDITLKEKTDKRDVAKMAMDKDVHMEILNIIKEHGVNLREGADGIRLHYEIAKTAYMEGLTAGMKIN